MSRDRKPVMRTAAVLAAAALLGTGLFGIDLSRPAYAENGSVSATGSNTFDPNRVAVLVGDSVTWTTTGGVNHTVTSSSANWRKDDGIQLVGRSTTFAFSKAGTYTYYCKTHGTPTTGMRGTVVVTSPTKPAPSPTRSTARPTPSPTAAPRPSPSLSRSPSPRPSRSPTPATSPSARPSPTASKAAVVPIGPPSPLPSLPTALPTALAGEPDDASPEPTVDLGSGGLGPRPSTGRGRGLPAFLALVALGGVVSAQVRALLALPPEE